VAGGHSETEAARSSGREFTGGDKSETVTDKNMKQSNIILFSLLILSVQEPRQCAETL